MIRGAAKFDALALGELTVSFLAPGNPQMKAKAAFVNSRTGSTHGWTTAEAGAWGKDTIAKLAELRALLERDLAAIHLDSVDELTGPTPTSPSGLTGGLGELVNGHDAAAF